MDAGIDHKMGNVYVNRRELGRGALCDGAKTELGARECRVAHPAAKTRGCASKEDRSATSRHRQPRRFPTGQESRVARHFPHLMEHALSGIDEAVVNVCANIE